MKKISRIEYCAGFEPLQSGMEQDEGSRILLPTMKPLDTPKSEKKPEEVGIIGGAKGAVEIEIKDEPLRPRCALRGTRRCPEEDAKHE